LHSALFTLRSSRYTKISNIHPVIVTAGAPRHYTLKNAHFAWLGACTATRQTRKCTLCLPRRAHRNKINAKMHALLATAGAPRQDKRENAHFAWRGVSTTTTTKKRCFLSYMINYIMLNVFASLPGNIIKLRWKMIHLVRPLLLLRLNPHCSYHFHYFHCRRLNLHFRRRLGLRFHFRLVFPLRLHQGSILLQDHWRLLHLIRLLHPCLLRLQHLLPFLLSLASY